MRASVWATLFRRRACTGKEKGRKLDETRPGELEKEGGGKLTWYLGCSVDELDLDVVEECRLDGYARLC